MSDYHQSEPKSDETAAVKVEECGDVETSDRGLFDFAKKKEEDKKCEEEAFAFDFEQKVQVCEEKIEEPPKLEKKHESLIEKLHRSGSSSSSSSDEEEAGVGGEKKKKKKKGLKEKLSGEYKKEDKCEETSVPVEKCDEIPTHETEEKKGFLDKIKEKLPGGKKTEEAAHPYPTPPPVESECADEGKEKKGFLDKIKEKIPGLHSKGDEGKDKEGCH